MTFVTLVLAVGPSIAVELNQVATVPAAKRALSKHAGIDLDHDSAREFVIMRHPQLAVLEFYESSGDDVFSLAHVLDLTAGTFSAAAPTDGGDGDDDGLADILVTGVAGDTSYVRIYESTSKDTYPTQIAWELVDRGAAAWIADTDNDGTPEIVTVGARYGANGQVVEYPIAVYESHGDNDYQQTFNQALPVSFYQSAQLADDLDGDGRLEILVGTVGRVLMYESTGDDAYAQTWTGDLFYTDGQAVNANTLVDCGDLDGDGRREFLVGGRKTVSAGSLPALTAHFLFEAVADNAFEIVATFVGGVDIESVAAANVADIDGDGRREIVIEVGTNVSIYRNTADDTWQVIWSENVAYTGNLFVGAGDHDRDGKEEIIFRTAVDATGIWEIDPADAADVDGDGWVDVIDNCPATSNPGQEDADGDAVGDACDNCVHGPNPTQGAAVLGQSIEALDGMTFGWAAAADVLWARGDLAQVGSYAIDGVQTLPLAVSFADAELPVPAAGFFYLVRPDCAVGSWQTVPGAEPARDAALP